MAIYLLARCAGPARRVAGDRAGRLRVRRDVLVGVGATAAVGIPGLGCYLLGRQLGLIPPSNTAGSGPRWPPCLYVVAAAANAGLEEIVMIGYRYPGGARPAGTPGGHRHLGADPWQLSPLQGFAGFIGNVVMGLAFGWYWQRTGGWATHRGAHPARWFSFVGYALLKNVGLVVVAVAL
ncbi:hypothetical protein FAM22021_001662 [Propionibacterium freudenreichii]|nr:hypothetical protein [Propionibacterium freudenreichii]